MSAEARGEGILKGDGSYPASPSACLDRKLPVPRPRRASAPDAYSVKVSPFTSAPGSKAPPNARCL